MNAKLICILIAAMFLFNTNASYNAKNTKEIKEGIFMQKISFIEFLIERLLERMLILQEDSVKIYGDYMYAQSFKPYFENLTEVKLKIKVVRKIKNGIALSLPWNWSFILGDLIVSIYDYHKDMPYNLLAEKKFSRSEVEASDGLLVWKLDKEINLIKPIDLNRYGKTIPKNEAYGSKSYFIVVRAEGGNPWYYYEWELRDDYYEDGEAWIWLQASHEWTCDEVHVKGKDFVFNLTGKLAYEEGDGVTRHYGIIVLWADQWKEVEKYLQGEIFIPHSNRELLNTLEEIDKLSDGDDVILLWIVGWSYHDERCVINGLSARSMEKIFCRMGAEGICMIFDCCYAGKFADPSMCCLAKPGRVILTSCDYGEVASDMFIDGDLWGTFTYYIYQGLKDPDVENTAENLFNYAYKPTQRKGSKWVHPQIYDGYDGELPI